VRAVLAHRAAGGSSTGAGVPVTRIKHNFVDDTVTADLEGRAVDSGGYVWRTDPTNAAAVGKVAADSAGRKGYTNGNLTVTTTQDSHVIASPPTPKSLFYGRMTWHVDFGGAGTTDDWRIGGAIPWFDPLGTAGQGPKSVAHISMVQDGMFLQEFDVDDPDNVIQQTTRTYAAPITDSRDVTVEWVIVGADDAVVAKCPDGTFLSLETANASTWLMNWLDLEIGCKNTDHRVYCTEGAGDWLDYNVDSSVVDHANSLLVESGLGYGPIVKPAAPPSRIDIISYTSARSSSLTLPYHAAGRTMIGFAHRIGSTTLPSVPTGWTDIGSASGGGSTSASRLFFKVADGTETSFTSTNATATAVVVCDDVLGFGTPVFQAGSGDITYPAATLAVGGGTSRVLRFAGHSNGDSYTTTPAGYDVLTSALSGGGVVVLADSAGGVSSNPTSATQTFSPNIGGRGVTLEVKQS
jgi:hypothetical protein